MDSSNTVATTGYIKATFGEESWEASSVVFSTNFDNFFVGGPREGTAKKGLFFSFPKGIQPGVYKMNPDNNEVYGWFNPGDHLRTWTIDCTDSKNTVTVLSVSEPESKIKMNFEFVAINPDSLEQRMRIWGTAEVEGESASNAAPYKQT